IALTNAIETRDPYTKEHLSRVVRYALLIAKGIHMNKDEMIKLKYACFLHDIGKIYIDESLLKKAKLSQEDFAEIKKHPQQGAKIMEGINFLEEVRKAVLYHQERYDGKGYPTGLAGTNIPLLSRIVSIADAFDAMTSDRPYKKKISFSAAMDEIEKNSGTQFDPELCIVFLKYRNSIEDIAKKHFEDPAE
ncbi:MAG: HD-GYP domain-containing protein, partial [Candidatus Omnitrophota bacterium]|nr:HD-GYP domain-containing protein [Candidatus Omnitrophota bacterium]